MKTIETAIVISVVLFIIMMFLITLFNEFSTLSDYTKMMISNDVTGKKEDTGNTLRLIKVISEKGDEILDEILEKYK